MSTIAPQTTPAVLEALGVSKRFGATAALTDASLRVRQGTVHALLGGNGSGKSTLFKCLAGVHTADTGTVAVRGAELAATHLTARRAHQLGLRFVHQDLGLFDGLTVAENIAIGSGFPTQGGRIRWRALRNRVAGLLDRLEIPAAPDTPVGTLRPATRTLVAIARALQDQDGNECVLLLDEPTASLPDAESRALMVALRQRAAAGQTIVLVSHRMREVLDVADDFTVFRDGRLARSLVAESPTEEDLVTAMAGRPVPSQRERSAPAVMVAASGPAETSASATASAPADVVPEQAGPGKNQEPVLVISDLAVGPLTGLELSVSPGEVVGIAGLLGSGRSTTLGAVFGLLRPVAGRVRLAGEDVTGSSTRAMMARGAALVPQDRLGDAVLTGMTVRENASLSVLRSYYRGWMRAGRERRDTRALASAFRVRTPSVETPLAALSGGNQQKVVLARWLRRAPSLLLLDEPTQGVDVVARADIYRAVRDSALAGCAVLVASSDFDELARLCDRVVVLRAGRAAVTVPAAELSADLLTALTQKETTLS